MRMPEYLSRLSLRARLLILVFVSVAPAFVLLGYIASEQRSIGEAQIRDTTSDLVKFASASFEELAEGSRQVLSGLSELQSVRDYDSAACNSFFLNFKKRLPMYGNIVVAKPDGDIFCSAVPLKGKITVADRFWFQETVKTGRFSFGKYQISQTLGIPVINAGFPVFDEKGQLKAVIGIVIDLRWFNEQLHKFPIPAESAITVIDRGGSVLARYPHPEKWLGTNVSETGIAKAILEKKEGTITGIGLEGNRRIFSFVPVKGTDNGMYICLGTSPDVAFSNVNKMLLRNMLLMLIIAFAVSVAAWFGADIFIFRRMEKLMKATDAISNGNLNARVDISNEKDEIVTRLGQSFNNMAMALEQDITDRKQAKQALEDANDKLRRLYLNLQSMIEEERASIAREIHDELGQSMTAIKFTLAWINDKYSDHKAISEKTSSTLSLIDSTIQSVKKICTELRPGLLDHLGLGAAIQWQAKEFQTRTGTLCEVSVEDIKLDKERATVLFRIFQEALTNVMRHANATKVTVRLKARGGEIKLDISDNGKGISQEEILKPDSFGLLGMRERVYPWNGSVDVSGSADTGTRITVTLKTDTLH
jgi:signal transduction histidine kinase